MWALIGWKPCFYNCMEDMEIKDHAIYAITNSMENLHVDKEGYFNVLVFYGLFYERSRNHLYSRVPIRYRNALGSLGELEITLKHSPCRLVFPLQFYRSPKLQFVFLQTVWNTGNVFYFLNRA